MKKILFLFLSIALLDALNFAFAQSFSAFTYQGRLVDNNQAANGIYDLRFILQDAANTQIATTNIVGVPVNGGLFNVILDFGSAAFNGDPRWLEIAVRTNGSPSYNVLVPRQPLAATPYAISAGTAVRLSPNANQTFSGSVTFTPAAGAPFAVSSTTKVSNLNSDFLDGLDAGSFWTLVGNTNNGTNFLGTLNNQPLEFRVNNQTALRIFPNLQSPNIVGGFGGNTVSNNVFGATIVGGGYAGNTNVVGANNATVVGGSKNVAAGPSSTIAGGTGNIASELLASIVGGQANVASAFAATVGGGINNTNSGAKATLGGGQLNAASSSFATVPGGYKNLAAGQYSFAAGRQAKATNDGSFVWSDSADADFISSGNNQFLIRASGGVGIGKNNPASALDIAGTVKANAFEGDGSGLTGVRVSSLGAAAVATTNLQDNSVTALKIAPNQVVKSINSLKDDVTLSAGPNITLAPNGNTIQISATGGGGGGTGWALNGNAGTTNGNFLGTRDDQPLEFRVGNSRALRLEAHSFSPNLIGGHPANLVSNGLHGATISGGGSGYFPNTVGGNGATIAGGEGNMAIGAASAIGGGGQNTAAGVSAVIAGGQSNKAAGEGSAIGGGAENRATTLYATVPGGEFNIAGGMHSFAAGFQAQALHDGSFVWADSSGGDFQSTGANQFLIRASGGVGIGTASPSRSLQVGDRNIPNSQGLIRLESRSGTGPANHSWDIGVPETDEVTTGSGYSFIIDDNQRGNDPEFMVQYGTGNVGIGTTTPNSKLDVAGDITWGTSRLNLDQGGCIELGPPVGAGNRPYIDFHYGTGFPQDFSVRLINDADEQLSLYGMLRVTQGLYAPSVNADNFRLTTSPMPGAVLTSDASGNGTWQPSGFRVQNNATSPNIIGGYSGNTIGSTVIGATISGGGANGSINSVLDDFGTVAGGLGNRAGMAATVGGGSQNAASHYCSTVSGGTANTASGVYAVVPGGAENLAAGNFSFAAGLRAKALHDSTFVWTDSSGGNFASTGPNQFLIRASGGVGIGTTNPSRELEVHGPGDVEMGLKSTDSNGRLWTIQSSGNVPGLEGTFQIIDRTAEAARVLIKPNGNVGIATSNPNALLQVLNAQCNGTTWNNSSDRALKENFVAVDGAAVLEKVVRLPIQQWNYKAQPGEKHLGPVAQDFQAAFGLGADDKHIATVDADGVALAAIQGLHQIVTEQKAELLTKTKQIESLEQRLVNLEKLVNSLVRQQSGGAQ